MTRDLLDIHPVSHEEPVHVVRWLDFTETGNVTMPATAMLTALHIMVTETVSPGYIANARRSSPCPSEVLQGLKSGIFAQNSAVQQYSLPHYAVVAGVPGLHGCSPNQILLREFAP